MPFSRNIEALGSSSASSSVRTSSPVLVADWDQISVSVQTSGALASRYTIWATNYDGFVRWSNTGAYVPEGLVEANWSTITGITAQGLFTLDPGMRWLRATRSAIDSQGTVIFAGKVVT